MRALVALVTVTLVALTATRTARADDAAPRAPDGRVLYEQYCLACHGERGRGDGPGAALLVPRPRDLTRDDLRARSVPVGQTPHRDDVLGVLARGVPGTAMPAYAGILDDAQLAAILVVLEGFVGRPFATGPRAPLPAPPAPGEPAAARAARGAALYRSAGCVTCHGEAGHGDGVASAALATPPFDLTRAPLRRGDAPGELFRTLSVGGGAMPGYAGALTIDERWDLVAHVDALRFRGPTPRAPGPLGAPPAGDTLKIRVGLHPPPQGPPPASLPPAAASLSRQQCARCHAKQAAEFRTSRHALAMGPGVRAQLVGATGGAARACQRCHAPLAEQRPGEASYDALLRDEGATCAGCHVRGHVRRGPPRLPDARLAALPSYPFEPDTRFERSELCAPCHQLGHGDVVAGKPILDTYREWLTGPYAARGVQCQHCHMPERAHTWKGVHDAHTVRQGVRLDLALVGEVATATLTNVGAGHYLPTTTTPLLVLELVAEDARGGALARHTARVARELVYEAGTWREVADTRLAPGEARAVPWPVPRATARVRATLTMRPDFYYEGFYARRLAGTLAPTVRADLERAAREAAASPFVVWRRDVTR